ncbi:MAG: zeta toxin family protein [Betaproteobacteria bacterium]|nr:zeta toxin family protein [Betaproteobacteria bacterium]
MNTDWRPSLIVIAGPNGSGKTFLTKKLLQHKWIEGCTYINPDNIARDLYGDWNSLDAVIAAARYAEKERERCLRLCESMAFESVLSTPEKVDFVKRARDEGYFIRLFFVGTDRPSINSARVTQRVMEGGHDVPIPKIISRYPKSIANCAAVASFADRAYVYDNSVDGEIPKLLFRTVNGGIARVYEDIHDWAQIIVGTLPRERERANEAE